MVRNKKGQITSEKIITREITKRLIDIANEAGVKIKPIIRDEMEASLRANIYASYQPATKKGKEVQEYNDTHKHQKTRPYHHTGLLASSIYCTIDGNTIKANVKDQQYQDGASTTEVYDYLKFGTAKTSEKKGYSYNNDGDFSTYISQPPHNFEAMTRKEMDIFLDKLENDLKNNPDKFIR